MESMNLDFEVTREQKDRDLIFHIDACKEEFPKGKYSSTIDAINPALTNHIIRNIYIYIYIYIPTLYFPSFSVLKVLLDF